MQAGQCRRDTDHNTHRDIWSPNGALTGAYSGTGTGRAALSYRKIPGQWRQCEDDTAEPAAVPLERRPPCTPTGFS